MDGQKDKVLVAACLAGVRCRYDARDAASENVMEFLKDRDFVPVCPEQLGGLCTPRTPAEIDSGDGFDVLDGNSSIFSKNGDDLTQAYVKGAQEAAKIAKMTGCNMALLKEKSPSCGVHRIYDGKFSGTLKDGCGAFCALLKREGIEVMSDEDV